MVVKFPAKGSRAQRSGGIHDRVYSPRISPFLMMPQSAKLRLNRVPAIVNYSTIAVSLAAKVLSERPPGPGWTQSPDIVQVEINLCPLVQLGCEKPRLTSSTNDGIVDGPNVAVRVRPNSKILTFESQT